MSNITVREAGISDAKLIFDFIKELAVFERAEHEVIATQEDIENSLFSNNATARALICEIDDKTVGYAVYFFNYSTWLGKYGLHLEDLYISPGFRHMGAGTTLLKHLAKLAYSNNCGRVEWNVLDWNEPAIQFYRSIGARPKEEWVGYRLTGKALEDFAKSE